MDRLSSELLGFAADARVLIVNCDDFDLPIEDEVTQKAGARIELDREGLLEIPRRLGYQVEYRRAERPAALTR